MSSRDSIIGALDWIVEAWRVTGKRGVSAGYHLLKNSWKPSYPETTGYIIPTLFECGRRLYNHLYSDLAVALADYELDHQTEDGAIHSIKGEPMVFDTGQVIFGYLATWKETGHARFLEGATRAADWLARVQSGDGSWKRYQHRGIVKAIDTRVAWALLEIDRAVGGTIYEGAARRNLNWATGRQRHNSWFDDCILRPGILPVTHTLAYTLDGLLQSGLLLGESDYIRSAQRTADVIMGFQRGDGFLPGEFGPEWEPSKWCCLTGNAQMAIVWFEFYRMTGESRYRLAAEAAIEFVKKRQNLSSRNRGVRGGIPGSSPFWGPYERFKYPNWAAKFFIDALLKQEEYDTGQAGGNH